jgi:hypothetical protein
MNRQAEHLARMFDETRADTLRLFDLADERELHQSPGFGYRPLIWHLAHIGVFEAYWLLQKLGGQAPPDERYERVFDPIQTPREESKDLPSRRGPRNLVQQFREGDAGWAAPSAGDAEALGCATGLAATGALAVAGACAACCWRCCSTLSYCASLVLDRRHALKPHRSPITTNAIGSAKSNFLVLYQGADFSWSNINELPFDGY